MVFFLYFSVLYSTLLHLPPLRFQCVGGCRDRAHLYWSHFSAPLSTLSRGPGSPIIQGRQFSTPCPSLGYRLRQICGRKIDDNPRRIKVIYDGTVRQGLTGYVKLHRARERNKTCRYRFDTSCATQCYGFGSRKAKMAHR